MAKRSPSPPTIDLQQLYYFLALAKHGSISAAAASLGRAQPSISESVRKLEKALDIQLAIRGAKGVVLTEAGQMLARKGRVLLDAAAALAEDVHEMASEASGSVSVGLPPSLSLLTSVPLAETIYSEYPNIRLRLAEALSGHVLDRIEANKLDLGFVYELPENSAFEAHPIMVEELFVAAAPDNIPSACPDVANPTLPVAALPTLPLILPSLPHGVRRIAERYAKANRINLNIVLEMDSLAQVVEMVSRASAYAILPHAAVARAVESGQLSLIRMSGEQLTRTSYMVRKRARSATGASQIVQKTLIKVIEEMIQRFGLHAALTDYAKAQLDAFGKAARP